MANIIKFKLKYKNDVRNNVEYCGKFPENNTYHIMYIDEQNEIGFTTMDDCEIII